MNRTGRVEGKLALVTGAGSGIGAASALALAREGAAVAVADIDLAASQRQVAVIESEGGRAIALQVDLGDEASVIAMVSLGQGAPKQVNDQISSMGTNMLIVSAGSQRMSGEIRLSEWNAYMFAPCSAG